MKYKLLCCFFNYFFNVKKHNYKGNPCQNFQFCSHTGPRFPFFEAFFVAAPPSNKEERGENFWENIGSVVRWYFGQYIWGLPNYYLANSDWMMMMILMPLHCITMSWWWWWWWWWWWCTVCQRFFLKRRLHCRKFSICWKHWKKEFSLRKEVELRMC